MYDLIFCNLTVINDKTVDMSTSFILILHSLPIRTLDIFSVLRLVVFISTIRKNYIQKFYDRKT